MLFRTLAVLLFITLQINAPAQTAPNFMVTDSWGHSHRLYEDYLDQGITVVIKVFYVACPPCNAIAPFLEPLYQSWGGGNADVQFIELSIKSTDTDAMINTYKNNHSTTFPACGGQGGSVAAVMPYTNGTFGQYTGTPTFVVIAPDRTVEYDVFGAGQQGTIMALDAAIAATGATGIVTSSHDPLPDHGIQLNATLVHDQLTFTIARDNEGFDLVIYNSLGQPVKSGFLQGMNGEMMEFNVADIPSGSAVCSIYDREKQRMVSYLFIKP